MTVSVINSICSLKRSAHTEWHALLGAAPGLSWNMVIEDYGVFPCPCCRQLWTGWSQGRWAEALCSHSSNVFACRGGEGSKQARRLKMKHCSCVDEGDAKGQQSRSCRKTAPGRTEVGQTNADFSLLSYRNTHFCWSWPETKNMLWTSHVFEARVSESAAAGKQVFPRLEKEPYFLKRSVKACRLSTGHSEVITLVWADWRRQHWLPVWGLLSQCN